MNNVENLNECLAKLEEINTFLTELEERIVDLMPDAMYVVKQMRIDSQIKRNRKKGR